MKPRELELRTKGPFMDALRDGTKTLDLRIAWPGRVRRPLQPHLIGEGTPVEGGASLFSDLVVPVLFQCTGRSPVALRVYALRFYHPAPDVLDRVLAWEREERFLPAHIRSEVLKGRTVREALKKEWPAHKAEEHGVVALELCRQ